MALKLPITPPFGFDAPEGYRRLREIIWRPTSKQIHFHLEDFKDEAARRTAEGTSAFGAHGYAIGPLAVPEGDHAVRGAPGKDTLVHSQAVPAYADYMAGPIGDDLPGITPQSTRGEVLAAIGYSFVKTRDENRGAEDV